MTRNQCKELQEAFNHYASGGDLWWYNGKGWHVQDHLVIDGADTEAFNIIEDSNFEARKAYALGEKIEYRVNTHYPWSSVSKPNWTTGEYRLKPKEPNICPQCRKNPGFHYIYTTSKGVFCSKECADKYEEYRPKHKEVYEWQYYKQHEDGTFTLSNKFYTEELDNKEYTKFEPSKRKRHG